MQRVSAMVIVCLALAGGSAAASESLGFAVSWLGMYAYDTPEQQDCPAGLNTELDWKQILRGMGRTPQEIEELYKPENLRNVTEMTMHRGRNGEDVCDLPESDYLSPEWKLVQGKTAPGVNLDGTTDGHATATTCQHEKFVTAEGARVDNQFYRISGCYLNRRGISRKSFSDAYASERMKEGLFTLLLELTGVDDLKNDPDVELTLYRGVNGLKTDASGEVMANGTYQIATGPQFRVAMKGSIKDGVLTTVPRDIDVPIHRSHTIQQLRWQAARFSFTIGEDRTLKGTLAGYQDIDLVWFSEMYAKPERTGAFNCPGYYRALKRVADGGKDPKTGDCTKISGMDYWEAVPAFLVHPDEGKTARSERPIRTSDARP